MGNGELSENVNEKKTYRCDQNENAEYLGDKPTKVDLDK